MLLQIAKFHSFLLKNIVIYLPIIYIIKETLSNSQNIEAT